MKFCRTKPNLYMTEEKDFTRIYFSIVGRDLIFASRVIDSVIGDNLIKRLKIQDWSRIDMYKTDLFSDHKEEMEFKDFISRDDDLVWGDFLQEFDNRFYISSLLTATAQPANVNFYFLIRNLSEEDSFDEELRNFEKHYMDHLKIDIEGTKEAIKANIADLRSKIGEEYASYYMLNTKSQKKKTLEESYFIGRINLCCFGNDKRRILRVVDVLNEKLEKFDGPMLSYDAPSYINAALNFETGLAQILYSNKKFVDLYKEHPNWYERLFAISDSKDRPYIED